MARARGALAPQGPCSFVIFGATGDLTKRLLMPALYNLAEGGLLPEQLSIVGMVRSPMTDGAFRQHLAEALKTYATRAVDPAIAGRLLAHVSAVPGDTDDPEGYQRLFNKLREIEAKNGGNGNRLYYLATPPHAFAPIVQKLAAAGLTKDCEGGWRRVIVEKPFGTDLASAQELNRHLLSVLREDQIFRMDHYLGKETVQNIMILRFANGLFEPIWNRNHIDHVQITVAETVTVERRGKFYDATGALRDMVPNHLFQLMSLISMEPPAHFNAHSVRSEKAEALDAISRLSEADVMSNTVRAQYENGHIHDQSIPAYRQELDVSAASATETYAALRLEIDNWRWAGVPFYLRTGKALGRRKTEVAIKFKEAPVAMFRGTDVDHLAQNFLVLKIQPDEGITLQFNAKRPGPRVDLSRVGMTFQYKDYFDAAPSTGYETLILDCMIGDAMLFQRADGVEAGWRAVQPVIDAWKQAGSTALSAYAAGSDGPSAANALLDRDGRRWRTLDQ